MDRTPGERMGKWNTMGGTIIELQAQLTALQTVTGSCAGSDHRPVIAKLAFRAD